MAMNNPNKFVNSVSEELKGEFDDEARKNKAAQKITDRSDSSVFLGLTIGVVVFFSSFFIRPVNTIASVFT